MESMEYLPEARERNDKATIRSSIFETMKTFIMTKSILVVVPLVAMAIVVIISAVIAAGIAIVSGVAGLFHRA